MNYVNKLKELDGQFDFEDYVDHEEEYQKAFISLINNKDYALAYKTFKHYMDFFKKIDGEIFCHYRPGMDYRCCFFALFHYALMNEKGVKGIVEKNKEEAYRAYLLLLKRFDQLKPSMRAAVIKKSHLLLKCAYPDANDRYSVALNAAGEYLCKRGDYKKAFKLFKKGADFDCSGRQIVYPFYLIAKNQNRVGDMYRDGLGVEKDLDKAEEYYRACAGNCGRKHHPKIGDFHLLNKDYNKAFICYTEVNNRYRYDVDFIYPDNLRDKYKQIFNGINAKTKKTKGDLAVLAALYKLGLGVERNEEKYHELLPKDAKWVEQWCEDYEDYHLGDEY